MKKTNYIYKNHHYKSGIVKVNVLVNKNGADLSKTILTEILPSDGKLNFDSIKVFKLKLSDAKDIIHEVVSDSQYTIGDSRIKFTFEELKSPLFISYEIYNLNLENRQYTLKSEIKNNESSVCDTLLIGTKPKNSKGGLKIVKKHSADVIGYNSFNYQIFLDDTLINNINLSDEFESITLLEAGEYQIIEKNIFNNVQAVKNVLVKKDESTTVMFEETIFRGTIFVDCVDKDTNEPVNEALVIIKDAISDEIIATSSSAHKFSDLNIGEYRVINQKGVGFHFRDENEYLVSISQGELIKEVKFKLEKVDFSSEDKLESAQWGVSEDKTFEYINSESLGDFASIVISKIGENDFAKYTYRISGDNNVFEILFLDESGAATAVVPHGRYEVIEFNNLTNEKCTQNVHVEGQVAKLVFDSVAPDCSINAISINEKYNTVCEDVSYELHCVSTNVLMGSSLGKFKNLGYGSYIVSAIFNKHIVDEKDVVISKDNHDVEIVFFFEDDLIKEKPAVEKIEKELFSFEDLENQKKANSKKVIDFEEEIIDKGINFEKIDSINYKDEKNNTGTLKINKLDASTKEMIRGAAFEFLNVDTDESIIISLEDMVSCTITDIPFGNYRISEVKSPPYYIKEQKSELINLSQNNYYVEINFYNSNADAMTNVLKFDEMKLNKKESNEVSELVNKMILEL